MATRRSKATGLRKKRSADPVQGAAEPVAKVEKATKLTVRKVQALIESRRQKNMCTTNNLFHADAMGVVNAMGDICYEGCTLLQTMGPLPAGSVVRTIDWLGSANMVLLSVTGNVDDMVALELAPGSIVSQETLAFGKF